MYAAYTEMNLNRGTRRGERVIYAPKRRGYGATLHYPCNTIAI